MRPIIRHAVIVVVALAGCVPPAPQRTGSPGLMADGTQPAVAGAFSGTFVTQGGSITLEDQAGQVTGSVTGAGISGTIQGVASGEQLSGVFTMADGTSGNFVAFATADGLQLTVEGGQPIVFVRDGGTAPGGAIAGGPTAPGAPPAPVAPAPVAKTGAKAPAPAVKAATGARVADDTRGWAVKTPAKWKHGVKDGQVVFGSDTEAGVIVVGFIPGVTLEVAEATIDQQIQNLGAVPLGLPRAHTFKAGRGLFVEMSAKTPDGAELRGRGAVVIGDRGAFAVLGITTEDKFATLRKRVDAIALSTAFFEPTAPRAPPAGNVAAVAGCYRYSAGTSVYVERTLRFDGQGGVTYNGASAANVEHKDSGGNTVATTSGLFEGSPDVGTYSVVGDAQVQIRWGDGSTAAYELKWEGQSVGALKSGDAWYLTCR